MNYTEKFIGERTSLPTRKWGTLTVEAASFTPASDGDLVVEFGLINPDEELLLRIHSECVFSETFGSTLCDCGDQLGLALQRIKENGSGILVYLRFDGRGAGLAAKVKATALEVSGIDTYESRQMIGVAPEGRDFSSVGRYLYKRGFRRVRCLTNSPLKIAGLRDAGLTVDVEPLLVSHPTPEVKTLFRTKKERFGHDIPSETYQ